jgi:Neuraminidase (sialidase)
MATSVVARIAGMHGNPVARNTFHHHRHSKSTPAGSEDDVERSCASDVVLPMQPPGASLSNHASMGTGTTPLYSSSGFTGVQASSRTSVARSHVVQTTVDTPSNVVTTMTELSGRTSQVRLVGLQWRTSRVPCSAPSQLASDWIDVVFG